MFKKSLWISIAVLFAATAVFFLFRGYSNHKGYVVLSRGEMESEEESEATINGAAAYLNSLKADLRTGIVDSKAVYDVYNQVAMKAHSKASGLNLKWIEMGPDNIGGRARVIVVDKDSNNVLYAGGVTGGAWKSTNGGATWKRLGNTNGTNLNINVTTMVQTQNGTLLYGTGESGFIFSGGEGRSPYGGGSFIGRGIFKSTDGGATFKQVTATDPGLNDRATWSNVHIMAADPKGNYVLAGNDGGLFKSNDNGDSWTKISSTISMTKCKDIHITSDGQTIYAAFANSNPGTSYQLWRSKDAGQTWTQIGKGTITSTSTSYVIAIAPSNEKIVYVSSAGADGSFDGMWRSEDGGDTWTVVGRGDANFNPLANQGFYDHCIVVNPLNPDHVIIGGLNLWQAKKANGVFQWSQLTNWSAEFLDAANTYRNPYFVHADQHYFLFDRTPGRPNLYITSDGGISKSTDITYATQPTFFNADYGFNTVQLYGIGVSAYDPREVIGGAQDNGTLLINQSGLTLLNADERKGGDGGFCEISKINPTAYFGEYIQGSLARSFNQGKSWSEFFDSHVPPAGGFRYVFITPFTMWESLNDPTSPDTVFYTDADKSHKSGEVVTVRSRNGYDMKYTLSADLPKGDTIFVQDVVQSKFYLTSLGSVWMTREALVPGVTPTWFKIADVPGFVPYDIKTSEDGNTVYISGSDGTNGIAYRITGLKGKQYNYTGGTFDPAAIGITQSRIFSIAGQVATNIDVDPANPEHVIITLGGYGFPSHVYRSKNALSAANPTFTNISSNLPAFPVYSALIDMTNPNIYLIGTEYGVYSSMDGGATWQAEENGIDRVGVFQLRQMKFSNKPWGGPMFYAATYGRGVFRSETLATGIDNTDVVHTIPGNDLKVYPNPATRYSNIKVTLPRSIDLNISIIDLQGRTIGRYSYSRQAEGEHEYRVETSGLEKGTYLVRVTGEGYERTSKLLIMND